AVTKSVEVFSGQVSKWRPLEKALGKYWLGDRGNVPTTGGPEQVAPLVVWLCTDAAANVNGRTFFVSGDEIGLFSEPQVTCSLSRAGGWDLESLDNFARERLIGDLTNDFLLESHPELQKFS
ncbi:MAG TPA: hypothetical protein VKK81_09230, partial [Candidatus Binatia bacterium]|nr:hypothetical protein [Candidatus Binatia bacterium]